MADILSDDFLAQFADYDPDVNDAPDTVSKKHRAEQPSGVAPALPAVSAPQGLPSAAGSAPFSTPFAIPDDFSIPSFTSVDSGALAKVQAAQRALQPPKPKNQRKRKDKADKDESMTPAAAAAPAQPPQQQQQQAQQPRQIAKANRRKPAPADAPDGRFDDKWQARLLPDLPIEQLAFRVAHVLSEKKITLMQTIMETLTVPVALDLLRQVETIQKNGGMYFMPGLSPAEEIAALAISESVTPDSDRKGQRKRTAGGVFIILARQQLTAEQWLDCQKRADTLLAERQKAKQKKTG